MGIKKDQTAARITLRTNLNFNSTSITSPKIKYQKPSGITGTWDADIVSVSKATGDICIDFNSTNKFDEKGAWTLCSLITFEDGRTATGDNVVYVVEESV